MYIAWRFYLVILLITLSVAGLLWRVFDLAVLEQHFLRQQGDERALRLVSIPSFRGMIMDRNGSPLAISTTVYSAWINPQTFSVSDKALKSLSRLTGVPVKNILLRVERNRKNQREFIYLKRSLAPGVAEQIKALSIPGVYLKQEYRRYYPEGEVMSHVIGFTNIDDQGQEGLELAYNQWLQGKPGKKWVIKDRLGRIISDTQMVQEQQPGHDLILSLDRRIQYLAYRELLSGVMQNEAKSGSAIVMNAKTGEVLAMVNVPSWNPNNRHKIHRAAVRNRAVTDIFEPGSTIKAFTVAGALKSGLFQPDSIVDTSPGWMMVDRHTVRDTLNHGLLSLAEILQLSSNMGAAKIVLALPPDALWSVLHKVGFGEYTGIAFPGEQTGVLARHHPWGKFMLATLSFGYGLSVTTLQLTRAYAVLANHGMKLPVSLLKLEHPPKAEQVLDSDIANIMLALLETKQHIVEGYRVAGKTGTARKVGEGGYQKDHHTSSFVGVAPLTNPHLVVSVVIHDPQGEHYYARQVSEPVFQRIMQGALRVLDVPPDGLVSSEKKL